jgi:hypothetical protein
MLVQYKFTVDETAKLKVYADFYFAAHVSDNTKSKDAAYSHLFGCIGDARTPRNYMLASGQNIPLPYFRFKRFCSIFEEFVKKNKDKHSLKEFLQWKEIIVQVYETGDPEKKIKNPKAKKDSKSTIINHVKVDPFISALTGSNWHLYALENGQIMRRVLLFKNTTNDNGYCDFTISSINGQAWVGDMRFIETDKLLVGICKLTDTPPSGEIDKNLVDENNYTHFAFKISLKSKAMTLSVGHMTFLSGQTSHVVTKTVILQRELDKPLEPKLLKFNEEIHPNEDFSTNIRSFFQEPLRNRLSSPHSRDIKDMKSFDDWMKGNIDASKINSSIIGEYEVFYMRKSERTSKEELRIDYLTITTNLKQTLEARFEERREDEVLFFWKGRVSENIEANTLTLYMEGPLQHNGRKLDAKPLFLMISVPGVATSKINTLTGIIAGIKSYNQGAVARLFVMKKMDDKFPTTDKEVKKIEKFFSMFKENGRVRPPVKNIISKFTDLERFIGD